MGLNFLASAESSLASKRCSGKVLVGHESKLNAGQVRALTEEIIFLLKRQGKAREREVFVRMSPEEAKDFDARQRRISEIYTILSGNWLGWRDKPGTGSCEEMVFWGSWRGLTCFATELEL